MKLNAVVQREMFAALDFRAAGEEASLQCIGEGETFWRDTLGCILSVHGTGSSNTHPSAGSSVTVPAGIRLLVCVHPCVPAMHSSCTAAELLCPQGQVFFHHAAF